MAAAAVAQPFEHFSRQDLCRILHLSERKLAAWERNGLLPASAFYSFSDLITLKTIQKLRDARIPVKRIQRSVDALRQRLGQVEHPLAELRISSDGRRILVGYETHTMEPLSGQLLFNFETRSLRDAVRTFKPAALPASTDGSEEAQRRVEAEDWFIKGLKFEETPDSLDKAIEAYQKAIELNPEAAGAFINLGTIYYNRHRLSDAETCYRQATQIDAQYALAHFNLGNVYDERGNLAEARKYYEEAIRLQPNYADAHYNLALVLDRLGLRGKALHHWKRYLKLDPGSPWAAYARQQIARAPFSVVKGEGGKA
jgi:tetratricopeptide (TPR) repeat protein